MYTTLTQFIPHRERSMLPSERPRGECCVRK